MSSFPVNMFFIECLLQWEAEAMAKDPNTRIRFTFQKAIKSIRKFVMPLHSGNDAALLEGIGKYIAKRLDKALADKRASDASFAALCPAPSSTTSASGHTSDNSLSTCATKKRQLSSSACEESNTVQKKNCYIPRYRSAAYGLVMALRKEAPVANKCMSKTSLMKHACTYCDVPMSNSVNPDSYYSGWSSMSTLISKGLVEKVGNPAKYSLTTAGEDIGERLEKATELQEPSSLCDSQTADPSCDKIIGVSKSNRCHVHDDDNSVQSTFSDVVNLSSVGGTVLAKDSFDVVLVIDQCERFANQAEFPYIQNKLRSLGVLFEQRSLAVADFVWIARPRNANLPDLMLDVGVERKRLDDLTKSIMGSRFKEQKYRLLSCGLRNIFYLCEDYGSIENQALPRTSLLKAMTDTCVLDGIRVARTCSIDDTCQWLMLVSTSLARKYNNIELIHDSTIMPYFDEQLDDGVSFKQDIRVKLPSFDDFMENSKKSQPVYAWQHFAKMLIQLNRVTPAMANVIAKTYRTPAELRRRYREKLDHTQRLQMLENLEYPKKGGVGKVGKAASELIHECFYVP